MTHIFSQGTSHHLAFRTAQTHTLALVGSLTAQCLLPVGKMVTSQNSAGFHNTRLQPACPRTQPEGQRGYVCGVHEHLSFTPTSQLLTQNYVRDDKGEDEDGEEGER